MPDFLHERVSYRTASVLITQSFMLCHADETIHEPHEIARSKQEGEAPGRFDPQRRGLPNCWCGNGGLLPDNF